MSGESNIRSIIFAWSWPEEPELVDFLETSFGSYLLMPLRYCALNSARRFIPSARLYDPGQLVDAKDRLACGISASENCKQFLNEASKYVNDPWLQCIEPISLYALFYYYHYWSRMLCHLDQRWPSSCIHCYGLFSRGAASKGLTLLVEGTLSILLARASRAKVMSAFGLKMKSRFKAWFGLHISRNSQYFLKTPKRPKVPNCALVVNAFIESDRRAQTGLVRDLLSAGKTDFAWVISDESRLPVSADERALDSDVANCINNKHIVNLHDVRWRKNIFATCANSYTKKSIYIILKSILPSNLTNEKVKNLSDLLVNLQPDMVKTYKAIAKILQSFHPKRLIINSSVGEMSYAQVWAEHNSVPVWRLPHGIEYGFGSLQYGNYDRVYVFGKKIQKELEAKRPSLKGRVHCCGGMHLVEHAAICTSATNIGLKRMNPMRLRVCLLVTSGCYNLPDTPCEIEQDLMALAAAITEANGELWVRCHPRQADGYDYPIMQRVAQEQGIAWHLSNSQSSLSCEINDCDVLVIRKWGGAGLAALYANRPLIGWLPRLTLQESDDFIRQLPVCVDTAQDVGRVIVTLQNYDVRTRQLEKQRLLLHELIGVDHTNPYAVVIRDLLKDWPRCE
ncbi:MAG: hypothetical protein EOM12_10335 [Verrucomicrobiae bacterium]|nr:hypothetical protein [Verrucomicrobiae bacterium]